MEIDDTDVANNYKNKKSNVIDARHRWFSKQYSESTAVLIQEGDLADSMDFCSQLVYVQVNFDKSLVANTNRPPTVYSTPKKAVSKLDILNFLRR